MPIKSLFLPLAFILLVTGCSNPVDPGNGSNPPAPPPAPTPPATSPAVANVQVTVAAVIGQSLTGSYTYIDSEGDTESGSLLQWYSSTTVDGEPVQIGGADGLELILTENFLGQYVFFQVTPRADTEPHLGSPAVSAAYGPVQSDDTTAPELLGVSPVDDTVSVALSSNLVLTFSEDLEPGFGSVTLGGTTWNLGSGSEITLSGNVVTVNPTADWNARTTYTNLTVSGFRDDAGNTLSTVNNASYGFTTWGITEAPSPDQASQDFHDSLSVNVSAESGAVVRITTNGAEPSESSSVWSNATVFNNTVTVKFRAFKSGLDPSAIIERNYTKLVSNIHKIVIMGSSTSEGYGATNRYGWAHMFADWAESIDSRNEVINIAKAGYSSADLLPTGDSNHNITKALSYSPEIIIINLPSNDASVGRPVSEQVANFQTITNLAVAQGITVYATTTQPRNFPEQSKRDNLIAMKAEIYTMFGSHTLDFWTTIANADGTINTTYNSGDGIHLNDSGHRLLFERVKAMNLFGTVGTLKKTIHYYTGWGSANMHYERDNWTWTAVPGTVMMREDSSWFKITIDDEARVQYCFNTGGTTWDSNGGLNYFTNKNEVWVKNGVVYEVKP